MHSHCTANCWIKLHDHSWWDQPINRPGSYQPKLNNQILSHRSCTELVERSSKSLHDREKCSSSSSLDIDEPESVWQWLQEEPFLFETEHSEAIPDWQTGCSGQAGWWDVGVSESEVEQADQVKEIQKITIATLSIEDKSVTCAHHQTITAALLQSMNFVTESMDVCWCCTVLYMWHGGRVSHTDLLPSEVESWSHQSCLLFSHGTWPFEVVEVRS